MSVETLSNPVVAVNTAETELANLQRQHETHQRDLQALVEQQSALEIPIAQKLTEAESLQQAIVQKQAELQAAQASLSVVQKREAKEFEARSAELKKKAAAVNAAYLNYQQLLTELVETGSNQELQTLSAAVKRERPLLLNNRVPTIRDIQIDTRDGLVIVDHGRNLTILSLDEAQKRNWELV